MFELKVTPQTKCNPTIVTAVLYLVLCAALLPKLDLSNPKNNKVPHNLYQVSKAVLFYTAPTVVQCILVACILLIRTVNIVLACA